MSHFQELFKGSVKNPITVSKSQKILREAQTN